MRNVELRIGDGSAGVPDRAPFDAICVTASAAGAEPPPRWSTSWPPARRWSARWTATARSTWP